MVAQITMVTQVTARCAIYLIWRYFIQAFELFQNFNCILLIVFTMQFFQTTNRWAFTWCLFHFISTKSGLTIHTCALWNHNSIYIEKFKISDGTNSHTISVFYWLWTSFTKSALLKWKYQAQPNVLYEANVIALWTTLISLSSNPGIFLCGKACLCKAQVW